MPARIPSEPGAQAIGQTPEPETQGKASSDPEPVTTDPSPAANPNTGLRPTPTIEKTKAEPDLSAKAPSEPPSQTVAQTPSEANAPAGNETQPEPEAQATNPQPPSANKTSNTPKPRSLLFNPFKPKPPQAKPEAQPASPQPAPAAARPGGTKSASGGTSGAKPSLFPNLFKPKPKPAVAPQPADPSADASAPGPQQAPAAILQISFDFLRTQVPRGTFSQSGKIWNHLDEQIIPADLAATLQRNGLRIARGKVASWLPIKALLDTERDVTAIPNSIALYNGLPLTLELDRQFHDQTVFLYRRDGSLAGVPLPGSLNMLRIEYAIPLADPNSVILDIMPEIRLRPEEPKLLAGAVLDRPMVPPSRVFRELAARAQIGPDEFLAIGPSPAAGQRLHLIGSLMLCKESEGRPQECMFFITPRLIRKEITPAANPAGKPGAVSPFAR